MQDCCDVWITTNKLRTSWAINDEDHMLRCFVNEEEYPTEHVEGGWLGHASCELSQLLQINKRTIMTIAAVKCIYLRCILRVLCDYTCATQICFEHSQIAAEAQIAKFSFHL